MIGITITLDETDLRNLECSLSRIRTMFTDRAAPGDDQRARQGMREAGVRALTCAQEEFDQQSRGLASRPWPRIGRVAAVFRNLPGAGKIQSWRDIEHIQENAQVLVYKGRIFDSMSRRHGHSPIGRRGRDACVFTYDYKHGEFGSQDAYLIRAQRRHRWAWDWDTASYYGPGPTHWDTFVAHVDCAYAMHELADQGPPRRGRPNGTSESLSAAPEREGGKASRAFSESERERNRFFFQLYNALSRHRRISVPARRFNFLADGPTEPQWEHIAAPVFRAVDDIVGGRQQA